MNKNSIEEEIEILEEFKTNGYSILLMKYGDRIKTNFKLAKAIEHILSDYKRVLKENEILKEEKEQAWEEWNNLEQGSYETEQKIKQQIKKLQKENEELKADNYELNNRINDLLDNISVQKVKDKIEEYKKILLSCYRFSDVDRIKAINERILELQELLEGRKI